MTDDRRTPTEPERAADEDAHELTFERGYGAQDHVLGEGETLADVAGVSEEDVREDLLGERDEQPDEDEQSE